MNVAPTLVNWPPVICFDYVWGRSRRPTVPPKVIPIDLRTVGPEWVRSIISIMLFGGGKIKEGPKINHGPETQKGPCRQHYLSECPA